MKKTAVSAAWALAALLAVGATSASAGEPQAPASSSELRTILPPAQSPPLSAEQRAKLARAGAIMPAPVAARTPAGKQPSFSSTGLPWPGAHVTTQAEVQAAKLAAMRERNHAFLLGARVAPVATPTTPAEAKPAPVFTARPLDPARASVDAARQAHKLATAHGEAARTPSHAKPRATAAPAPSPTALSPEQLAKQAQVRNANGGSR